MATVCFFPVWKIEELQKCYNLCYQAWPENSFLKRIRIYGGVSRYVFHKDFSLAVPKKMAAALSDVNAVRGVKPVGVPTDIFGESHTR